MKLKDYEVSYRKSKHKEAEVLKTKITALNNIDAKEKAKEMLYPEYTVLGVKRV